jgi:hypothetical protein
VTWHSWGLDSRCWSECTSTTPAILVRASGDPFVVVCYLDAVDTLAVGFGHRCSSSSSGLGIPVDPTVVVVASSSSSSLAS